MEKRICFLLQISKFLYALLMDGDTIINGVPFLHRLGQLRVGNTCKT